MSRSSLTIGDEDRLSRPPVGPVTRDEFKGLTALMVASVYTIGLAALAAGVGVSLSDILAGTPAVAAIHLLAIPLLALPCLGTLIGKVRRKEPAGTWGAFTYLLAILAAMVTYGQLPFGGVLLALVPFGDVLASSGHLLPPVLLVAVLTWLTVETISRRKQAPDRFQPADASLEEPGFAAAA